MSPGSGLDYWMDGGAVHWYRKYRRRRLALEEAELSSSQLDIQIWNSGLEITQVVVEAVSWREIVLAPGKKRAKNTILQNTQILRDYVSQRLFQFPFSVPSRTAELES